MSNEDPDVCEALRSLLADEGIDILLNTRIKHVSGKSGDSVTIVFEQNGTDKTLTATHLLVATGRTPNTEGLGLVFGHTFLPFSSELLLPSPDAAESTRLIRSGI